MSLMVSKSSSVGTFARSKSPMFELERTETLESSSRGDEVKGWSCCSVEKQVVLRKEVREKKERKKKEKH